LSGRWASTQQWAQRTCDVEIENVILLDDIVYELLAVLVDYEYLPLFDALAMAARGPQGVRAYVAARGGADGTEDDCAALARSSTRHHMARCPEHTLALDVYHGDTRHVGGVRQPMPPTEARGRRRGIRDANGSMACLNAGDRIE
jgi:hypothetical protein